MVDDGGGVGSQSSRSRPGAGCAYEPVGASDQCGRDWYGWYGAGHDGRVVAPPPAGGARFVSDLPFVSASNAWGPVERDRSNGEAGAADGRTLTLQGQTFVKGLGTHAGSDVRFVVPAGCTTLTAVVGLDDEVGSGGSAVFQVFDGVSKTFDSGLVRVPVRTSRSTATLTPGATARLVTTDNGNGNGQRPHRLG